jgi:hypothetical protein
MNSNPIEQTEAMTNASVEVSESSHDNNNERPVPTVHETPELSEAWVEPLGAGAYHGLAGKIVHFIKSSTEADPGAILLQLLARFGDLVGQCSHSVAEGSRHTTNVSHHGTPLMTAPVQPGDCSAPEPEFGRFPDLRRQFGLNRGDVYELIKAGLIKTVPLRLSGGKTAVRLIHLPSLREYLYGEMKRQTELKTTEIRETREAQQPKHQHTQETRAGHPVASSSRFVFKRIGGYWWFQFDGQDYGDGHKQLDGFLYIACLLGRKPEAVHCVELKLGCKQPPDETTRRRLEQLLNAVRQGYGPKQKYASKRRQTDWQGWINKFDGLIAEAREACDLQRVEELEAQKEQVEKEQAREIGFAGRLRPETIEEVLEDQTRKAVGKAMKGAIVYLKKNCPNLGEHLGDNKQGIECFSIWPRYQGKYDWDTESVSGNCYCAVKAPRLFRGSDALAVHDAGHRRRAGGPLAVAPTPADSPTIRPIDRAGPVPKVPVHRAPMVKLSAQPPPWTAAAQQDTTGRG